MRRRPPGRTSETRLTSNPQPAASPPPLHRRWPPPCSQLLAARPNARPGRQLTCPRPPVNRTAGPAHAPSAQAAHSRQSEGQAPPRQALRGRRGRPGSSPAAHADDPRARARRCEDGGAPRLSKAKAPTPAPTAPNRSAGTARTPSNKGSGPVCDGGEARRRIQRSELRRRQPPGGRQRRLHLRRRLTARMRRRLSAGPLRSRPTLAYLPDRVRVRPRPPLHRPAKKRQTHQALAVSAS